MSTWVNGANLLSQLCSIEPDAPPPDPVAGPGEASPLTIAAAGLVKFAPRPWELANVLPSTISAIIDTLGRAPCGRAMARLFAVPQTPFNASITAHRNIAFARLDLEDIKNVKNRFNVKFNDVVMALYAAMLRRFLYDRVALPDTPLVATVPVSVHETSDRPGRNQISAMFTRLQTDIADPAEQLRAIARAAWVAKDHSSAIGATLLQDWMRG